MPVSAEFRPAADHLALGGDFFDPVEAARFPTHILRYRNQRWAERTGLGALSDEEWIAHFGRFEPLPGSLQQPVALRYHGHQFRSYNPDLGDGRGFLFAQARDLEDGRLLDFGTKGSGQTPYSRTADGRLTLKGGVREVLATEILEALGVDTSKSFSLIETGESLYRGDEPSPTRSSVLVRLSYSHIRIGSFQRLLYRDEHDNIVRLLDHTIRNYMPEVWRDSLPERAAAFVEAVCRNVARTGAHWMLAGFVHGVLNTDNINVTGESFDYGPWRFLSVMDPKFTAAYFDQTGLYAFGRQPDTLLWNLTRLAECFLPFVEQAKLERALGSFEAALHRDFAEGIVARLGLAPGEPEQIAALTQAFWTFLARTHAPFEQAFFDWRGGLASFDRARASPAADHYASPEFEPVMAALEGFGPAADVNLEHPYFSRKTPCTMLIDEVEDIWEPIAERDDWSALHAKLAEIALMRKAYGVEP